MVRLCISNIVKDTWHPCVTRYQPPMREEGWRGRRWWRRLVFWFIKITAGTYPWKLKPRERRRLYIIANTLISLTHNDTMKFIRSFIICSIQISIQLIIINFLRYRNKLYLILNYKWVKKTNRERNHTKILNY